MQGGLHVERAVEVGAAVFLIEYRDSHVLTVPEAIRPASPESPFTAGFENALVPVLAQFPPPFGIFHTDLEAELVLFELQVDFATVDPAEMPPEAEEAARGIRDVIPEAIPQLVLECRVKTFPEMPGSVPGIGKPSLSMTCC